MKIISGKEFEKILQRNGWQLKRINGSYYIFSHPDKREIISVHVHKNNDLKKGLLKKLMTLAGITENEL